MLSQNKCGQNLYLHLKWLDRKNHLDKAIPCLYKTTAKYYDLTLISNDKDLDKLEKVYESFLNG